MKNKLFTILALALVFISVMMLAAAIQYSSGLIDVKSQPQLTFSSDINITGQSNRTDSGQAAPDKDNSSTSVTGPDISKSQMPNMDDILKSLGGLPELIDNPPDSLLIVIAILVVLLLLAIIGYILWRRRKRGQKMPVVDAVIVEKRAALEYHEGDYTISFPQISAQLPVIWGINERLEVAILDKTGEHSDATISVDDKVIKEITAEHGAMHVSLDLAKGDHRIIVSPGNAPGSSSWADVRIVDYREEVVRMFNEMYQVYRSSHEVAGDGMTARELELVMRKDMQEELWKNLGNTITLFEYANYSLHSIQRKDFEDMYLSRIGLIPAGGVQNVDVE